jgi:pimeloyl-ACP methyl ester carboxylesterase
MPSTDAGARPVVAAAGQPVVLLHCSAGSGAQWQALRAALNPQFRVETPDLYGYGTAEPWVGPAPLTLAAEAAPVAALIERCGEPVHLVGHSYGGAVALRLALDHPELLRSLTVIEPVAFHLLRTGGAGDRALFAEIARLADAVGGAAKGDTPEAGMARFVDFWNGEGAWARLTPERQVAFASCAGKIALEFWATTTEATQRDDYRGLAVSTLILRGAGSPAATRRIAGILALTIPAAGIVTVEGAGHMLPLTHADSVNAAVVAHIVRRARPPLTLASKAQHNRPATISA